MRDGLFKSPSPSGTFCLGGARRSQKTPRQRPRGRFVTDSCGNLERSPARSVGAPYRSTGRRHRRKDRRRGSAPSFPIQRDASARQCEPLSLDHKPPEEAQGLLVFLSLACGCRPEGLDRTIPLKTALTACRPEGALSCRPDPGPLDATDPRGPFHQSNGSFPRGPLQDPKALTLSLSAIGATLIGKQHPKVPIPTGSRIRRSVGTGGTSANPSLGETRRSADVPCLPTEIDRRLRRELTKNQRFRV